jgi:hypothetical protein
MVVPGHPEGCSSPRRSSGCLSGETAYIERLVAFRAGRVADWIGSFATASARAALTSIELADQVAASQAARRSVSARAGAGRVGGDQAHGTPSALPLLSAPTARAAVAVSRQPTLAALERTISETSTMSMDAARHPVRASAVVDR